MKNIRTSITDLDDDALRASLKLFGWKKDLPAIQDQDGSTVVGHRRLRLAKQLGIEPVIKSHHFKDDTERRELQVASNVGFSEMTKDDRVKVAQQMLADNPKLTQEEIAKALNVNRSTISRDQDLICADAQIKKPAKTERNPKGAGRPRGGTKSKAEPKKRIETEQEKQAAILLAMGKTTKEVAVELGVGDRRTGFIVDAVKIRQDAEANIDPATLSLTAQQKLDLAIKQATRKLEIEINQRIHAEMLEWLQRQLDHYKKKEEHYDIIIKQRQGIMKRADYRSILSCLHPDRVQDPQLKQRYEHAFNLFTRLEKAILDEKESPTTERSLPKTVEELLKRRAEYQAQKASQRAAKRGEKNDVAHR